MATKVASISVDVRLSTKEGSLVKAFADVTITLADEGTISILGCSILHAQGKAPRVMFPARKGKTTWFDIVQASGTIRGSIESAVLAEYERQSAELR
jgi:DNA-binding cell septation regulator SpoVG